jgi:hypothetical protein
MPGKSGRPKPSASVRAAQKKDSHAPKRDRFRSKRIAIVGVIGTTTWTVVTTIAKMPELAQAGAAAGLGIVGVWELMKSDYEDRKKDK